MKPVIWLAILPLALYPAVAPAEEIGFDAQIRPILSDHCFPCHGPDEATREAGLRLDTAEGAFEDRGGYAAFVAGDVDRSAAIERILAEDPSDRMPPAESKLELTKNEKELLSRWVREGANWSKHWAFVPPTKPAPPKDASDWSRNPIDQFVRAAAERVGLRPNPEASPQTLIRRLCLDLTGLPPTPQQIEAFLSDPSADAYENLVDRLLASPHYGERMAWDWMDAARYADTDGFQGDPTRTMWPWRDWVVDALNDNMPFDQFTIEMLAGDLLEDPSAEQVLATGFNRNHMFNGEGGRIAEETRVENVFDRTETTATVWLGLTMTCCRCHDHKFDPISQQEYYRLYAFFNNTSETGKSGRGKTPPLLEYLDSADRRKRQQVEKQLASVQEQLTGPLPAIDQAQQNWMQTTRRALGQVSGKVSLGNWWRLGPIESPGREAFDQDLGPESDLDLQAPYGDVAFGEQSEQEDGKVIELPETVGATYFYRTIRAPSARSVEVSLGSDDAIKVFLNGEEVLANFARRAAAPDQERVRLSLRKGENHLLIKVVNVGGIGGFYFQQESESRLGLPADVVAALLAKTPTEDQKTRLQQYYRSRHWDDWPSLDMRREQLTAKLEQLSDQSVTVMVMDQLPAEGRRKTFVLDRGGYDKPTGQQVTAGTPAVLPPLPEGASHDRLTLARWIVERDHPLTARVTVNRYWQTFFGKGIVESTEDFGVQGSRPTHPKLLDYLAVRFIESGWNVKQLHKLIVMSATYRQSAAIDPQEFEADPENIYLARSPRYRLPSWMLRDQALAAAGLLNYRLGGPPVRPYQPEGIWAEATFGKIRYQHDEGENLYRRSLYVFWRRIVGPTMFFDSAKRQTCEVKPTRTNTPLHALTTMNETAFVEAARAMAQRVMKDESTERQRVIRAFQLATARAPEPDEVEVLLDRLRTLQQDYRVDPDAAKQLLAVGQSPRDEGLNTVEHAAYTLLCSLVMNLDETLTRP